MNGGERSLLSAFSPNPTKEREMGKTKARSGAKSSRAASCKGKRKYTRNDAIDEQHRQRNAYGDLVSAYKCIHKCRAPDGTPGWHLGHNRKKR